MTPHETTPPKTLPQLLRRAFDPAIELMEEPLPKNVGFWHVTGSLCLFMVTLQVVTGILMAFYYTPSPESAWESIRYVEAKVSFGRIIHGLHHWGSSGFVVMIFIHMLRVFTFAAYKGPRKWTWLVGVGLLGIVLAFGFTGYLLPWDMKAYFGTQVGTNIIGSTPKVGFYARDFLLGGPEISELTLPRFYALHVLVLPLLLGAGVGAHLYLVRLYGITPPWKRDDEPVEYPTRFFPHQAFRDSLMILIVFSLLTFLAWAIGADLEDKADPLTRHYAPHPEWYFLGLQQLLRYFKGPYTIFATVIIPAGFFLILVALPFVDWNRERELRKRPIALTLAVLLVITVVGLTVLGYTTLREERRIVAAAAAEEEAANANNAKAPPLPSASTAIASTTKDSPTSGTQIATPSQAPVSELVDFGHQLYEVLKCADCHAMKEAGRELNIPPSLDFAGDRFTHDWLRTYMKEVPLRRFENKNKRPLVRMPDFRLSDRELDSISAYLVTLRKPDLFASIKIDPAQSTPEKIEEGKQLYSTESCGVCHSLNGRGGKSAPDLTGVGKRLAPEFIFAMIKKPQSLIPGTAMEDSLLEDPEVQALTHYLLTLQ